MYSELKKKAYGYSKVVTARPGEAPVLYLFTLDLPLALPLPARPSIPWIQL